MALTLPYPSMNFVPLDVLTASEMNQLVSNIEYIAGQFPITSANLGTGGVATANLADYSITRVKLNHLDLVNNGEWVCVGYAYLATSVASTTPVTLTIPNDYQGQKMQYKVVGAYETTSVGGGSATFVQVKTNGIWQGSTNFCDRHISSGVVGDTQNNDGNSRIFGHRWESNSDWDSCSFEFTASSAYPGSHWTFTGTAGGMSGGRAGMWAGGGRLTDGHSIEALRLASASSVTWGQGSGFAVFVRRKNF